MVGTKAEPAATAAAVAVEDVVDKALLDSAASGANSAATEAKEAAKNPESTIEV